jgi:peptidylprolyl isomerase
MVFIFISCKDSSQNFEINNEVKDTITSVLSKEERLLNNVYKVRYSQRGDTLLPYIPQDSVSLFFKRYGAKNLETKVRLFTKYGNIDFELFEETPLYRASFIFLVKNKYFDLTAVYRVVPRFVIQAGNSEEPLASMKRNSTGNYKLPPHFLEGEKHERGSLSLAKAWENNPENWHNPFDFFITLEKSPHLDQEHTIFGKVISGMDVADTISQFERDESDWPLQDVFITMRVIE